MSGPRVRRVLLLVIALAALAATGCDAVGEEGTGIHVTEERDLEAFTGIRVSHSLQANIEVVPGADHDVQVTFDDNLIGSVATEVHGSTLVIETIRNIRPTVGSVIEITMPVLDDVTASGGTRVRIAGTTAADRVDVLTSGAAHVTFEAIESELLVVGTSGGSTVEVDGGDVAVLRLDGSGSAELRAEPLQVSGVELSLSGSSDARVRASDSVMGSASGSSSVAMYGNPVHVEVDTSGSASANHVD